MQANQGPQLTKDVDESRLKATDKIAQGVSRIATGSAAGAAIGAATDIAVGSVIASVVPGIGTVMGAVAGGIVGAVTLAVDAYREKQTKDAVAGNEPSTNQEPPHIDS